MSITTVFSKFKQNLLRQTGLSMNDTGINFNISKTVVPTIEVNPQITRDVITIELTNANPTVLINKDFIVTGFVISTPYTNNQVDVCHIYGTSNGIYRQIFIGGLNDVSSYYVATSNSFSLKNNIKLDKNTNITSAVDSTGTYIALIYGYYDEQ